MTVSSATSKSGPYTGNGVTTVFPYGFRILDASHIRVIRTENGVDAVVSSGFTVSGVGSAGGGNVTFSVPPAAGQKITLIRNAPFTQQTDLENQGAYYAETIEEAFDLAAMRDQQLQEQVDRSLKIAVGAEAAELDILVQSVITVADNIPDVNAVAADIASVNAVAPVVGDVATVADNVADVTWIADVYYGPSATDPLARRDGSALQDGDFYFNTAVNLLRVRDGGAWHSSVKTAGVSTYRYTATAGQTVFTGADLDAKILDVEAGSLIVHLNGVALIEGVDFSVTAGGASITLVSGAALSDELAVVSFDQLDFAGTILQMTELRDETENLRDEARLAENNASTYDPTRRFATVALLLASNRAAGGAGTIWQAEGFLYREAAAGATDHHVTTAGGVKLYALSWAGDPVSLRPAYLEQFISGFFGRGMLDGETINIVTEQAIAASAAAGSSTVVATDATNFLVGGCVSILHDNGVYGTYFVAAKSGNTLTIRPGLRYAVTTTSRIERTWFNRAHPGKFYMRELAQRIARSTELDAAMPDGRRMIFTTFTSATAVEDRLVAVGGATISYFAASNLGSSGDTTTPVRFAISRTALVAYSGTGQGAETPLFAVPRDGNYVAKIIFASPSSVPTYRVEVITDTGAVLASYTIPGGQDQSIHQVYTVPFAARSAAFAKVRITCTANASSPFYVDEIDVFEAPVATGRIISKRQARIVCLGDSWVAGDLGGSLQREPITQQLAIELPDAKIINAGVGGQKIWEQLARFDTDVTPHRPDYVVVSTGTNECYNPASAIFDPNSLDFFIAQWRLMISKIVSIGARPIIIGVPALAETDGAFSSWLLNDRARLYVQRFFEFMGSRPYVNGAKSGLEAYRTDLTLTTGATPSVAYARRIDLDYASPTTITNLLGGVTGQVVTLVARNGNVTLQHGILLLDGSANVTLSNNSTITLMRMDTDVSSAWVELARSIPATAASTTITITSGTTPSVAGARRVILDYASPATITNFTGGIAGQEIDLIFANGNVTLDHNAAGFLRLTGSVDVTPTTDSMITLISMLPGSARWIEKSRSIK